MNKTLVCTAVSGALALGAGTAGAYFDQDYGSALVPYVVKDSNRTTVVTVILSEESTTYSEQLHLQYWTKSTTDANTAACQPSSVQLPVTPNDMVTFDTAGILGYPLFGDTTNPAPLGTTISYAAPRHGFLYIESPDEFNSTELGIAGAYWLELDIANGGAYGDHTMNDFGPDLMRRFDRETSLYPSNAGSPFNMTYAKAVAFWPSSVASTVFNVTPLGTDMLNRENNQVVLQVFNSSMVQGAYDRNENGVDGTVPITVRCVGRVTPAQLMPGVVANAAWAAQGGWGWLNNLGDNLTANDDTGTQGGTNSGDLDAIVYQVDSSSAGGKFMTNASRISSCEGYNC